MNQGCLQALGEVVDIVKEPMGPAGVTDEEDLLSVSEPWQGPLAVRSPVQRHYQPTCVSEATLQRLEGLFHDQIALLVQVEVNRAPPEWYG